MSRELEADLVPEWRAKYLDYKVRITTNVHATTEECQLTYCIGRKEEAESCRSRPAKDRAHSKRQWPPRYLSSGDFWSGSLLCIFKPDYNKSKREESQ